MVDHVQNVGPAGNGGAAQRARKAYRPDGPAARGNDAVEMSADMQRLQQMEGIRLDKVMEVRRALEAGTYVTEEKLDAALERAMDDVRGTGPDNASEA